MIITDVEVLVVKQPEIKMIGDGSQDTAVVRVKYKNGAIGVIEGTTCAYPGLDNIFSIHGSEGSISFGNDGFLIWNLKDKNIKMPEIKAGDLLAVLSTGAYNYSMASNYNRIPRPPVVMVRDGKTYLAVKRESYEDILKNDI